MRREHRGKWAALLALPLLGGCLSAPPAFENPTTVGVPQPGGLDAVRTTVVMVLERYFPVSYENRYDGRIETAPEVGASLLEFWRRDSVGLYQRLEASFQTIRRRAYAQITPNPRGDYTVTVEVYKELEDLAQPAFALFGGGPIISSIHPNREEPQLLDVRPGAGWISLGRDTLLENKILAEIHRRLDPLCQPAP